MSPEERFYRENLERLTQSLHDGDMDAGSLANNLDSALRAIGVFLTELEQVRQREIDGRYDKRDDP